MRKTTLTGGSCLENCGRRRYVSFFAGARARTRFRFLAWQPSRPSSSFDEAIDKPLDFYHECIIPVIPRHLVALVSNKNLPLSSGEVHDEINHVAKGPRRQTCIGPDSSTLILNHHNHREYAEKEMARRSSSLGPGLRISTREFVSFQRASPHPAGRRLRLSQIGAVPPPQDQHDRGSLSCCL